MAPVPSRETHEPGHRAQRVRCHPGATSGGPKVCSPSAAVWLCPSPDKQVGSSCDLAVAPPPLLAVGRTAPVVDSATGRSFTVSHEAGSVPLAGVADSAEERTGERVGRVQEVVESSVHSVSQSRVRRGSAPLGRLANMAARRNSLSKNDASAPAVRRKPARSRLCRAGSPLGTAL